MKSSLWDHIKNEYGEKLDLSEIDIDEIVEDLEDFNINSVENFEKHILYADKWREGISSHASKLYAEKYKLDPNVFYQLDHIDYSDYLFFFHGEINETSTT